MKISQSILDCDFLNLEKEIKRLEKAKVDYIHIDLMDGHFVPNVSMGINIIRDIKKITAIPLDIHLMFEQPLFFIDMIDKFLGGDVESIITIHAESKSNTKGTLEKIEKLGYKKGISLKPKTPIGEIKEHIKDVDLILQMTVEPGFGGQRIIPEAIEKIKEIKKTVETSRERSHPIISADGGITEETAALLKEAGCDMIVPGSAVWKSKNIKKTIENLKG